MIQYFNPRAPCGARRWGFAWDKSDINFNPRAPCGARRREPGQRLHHAPFQSTRPLRGATEPCTGVFGREPISIHAPLAGRDRTPFCHKEAVKHFNPRAPCGARPVARGPYHGLYIISIHAPLAGRDVARLAERMDRTYFNPRAPCGARQQAVRYSVSYISFQSTRPLRGATRDLVGCSGRVGISIHAPLAGRDRPGSALQSPCCYFNPRAPCGARLRVHSDASGFAVDFNPRAPCGARRLDRLRTVQRHRFQSTRPLRGATLQRCCSAVPTCDFNPRAPCGARLFFFVAV